MAHIPAGVLLPAPRSPYSFSLSFQYPFIFLWLNRRGFGTIFFNLKFRSAASSVNEGKDTYSSGLCGVKLDNVISLWGLAQCPARSQPLVHGN